MQQNLLEAFGQLFVKQALHAKQPDTFKNFLNLKVQPDHSDTSKQLLQFLQQESLEEQRVNYLNMQARQQCQQAMTNMEKHREELILEQEILDKQIYQKAQQQLDNFIKQAQKHIQRYIDVWQQNKEQCELQQKQKQKQNQYTQEELADDIDKLVKKFPLLQLIKQYILKINNSQQINAFEQFKNFKGFYEDQNIQNAIDVISTNYNQQVQQQPELKQYINANKQLFTQSNLHTQYSFLKQILEKINLTNYEIPDISLIDVQNVYPLPEPTEKAEIQYVKAEKDVCTVYQLLDFVEFLTLNVNVILNNEQFETEYYQNEIQDECVDKQFLINKESAEQKIWWVFQDFTAYQDDFKQKKAQLISQEETKKDKKPAKKDQEEQKIILENPTKLEDFQLPEYFNTLPTKIILTIGQRRQRKTDFVNELVEQIKEQFIQSDYLITHEKAIVVTNQIRDLDEFKKTVETILALNHLEAPRFLIFDQIPFLDQDQIEDLNSFCLEKVKQQQFNLNKLLTQQNQIAHQQQFGGMENLFPAQLKISQQSPSRKSAKPGQRVQEEVAVQQKYLQFTDYQTKNSNVYSAFFKIFIINTDLEQFLQQQFGRIQLIQEDMELTKNQLQNKEFLIEEQIKNNLNYITPKGQNFILEHQLFLKAAEQFELYYQQKHFGLIAQELKSDSINQVIVKLQFDQIKEDIYYKDVAVQQVKLLHEQLQQNIFVLDTDDVNQNRLNSQLLFKLCKHLNIKYNPTVVDYKNQTQQIYDKMDQKKLKLLQTQYQKEQQVAQKNQQATTVFYEFYDQKVLNQIRNNQLLLSLHSKLNEYVKIGQQWLKQKNTKLALQSVTVSSHLLQKYQTGQLQQFRAQFKQLLTADIQPNFIQVVEYMKNVNKTIANQEVIVADEINLIDKICNENLASVQKIYVQLSNQMKNQFSEQFQINKKLPYNIIKNTEQLIQLQFKPEEEVGRLHKVNSNSNIKKQPVKPGTVQNDDITAVKVQNDNQYILLLFFQRINQIRNYMQQFYNARMQLLQIIFGVYCAQHNFTFFCSESQKSQIPQKQVKLIDPIIQQFENQLFIDQQFDVLLNNQDVTIDKYLETIETVYQKMQSQFQMLQFQCINNANQDIAKIELNQQTQEKNQFLKILNEFECEGKQNIEELTQQIKQDMEQITVTLIDSLKEQQTELEKCFAQTGAIVVQITQKLQEKVGCIENIVLEDCGKDESFKYNIVVELQEEK